MGLRTYANPRKLTQTAQTTQTGFAYIGAGLRSLRKFAQVRKLRFAEIAGFARSAEFA